MNAYDSIMSQSAAVMVLDHMPDEDELEEIVYNHLDDLDEEEAEAAVDIVYEAPDFMTTGEQDQINAHMRDGGACVLVLYITTGEAIEEDEDL